MLFSCKQEKGRQRGRVVRAPDLKSGGPGFKVVLGREFNSLATLVNSQLVCLPASWGS